jgi:signal transduction histidine kinase
VQRQGSITGWRLATAVLLVIVVNAQLTWWIIFTTGQARDRLELERTLLEVRARSWVEISACAGRQTPPVPEGLEVVAAPEGDSPRPTIVLHGDPDGRVIRPTRTAWNHILDEYRKRIVMMVSEGAFFAFLLFVFMVILWRTFRREVELERRHRNFLSAITHELKSPIAAIRVALETVVMGRADEKTARKFISNAMADTDRLDRLVQKVLQATRYGSGVNGIRLDRRSLSWVVEGAIGVFEPGALAAGAMLTAEISDNLWAEIDDEAMAIAVSNLLENALKYGGDPAEIRIELRREGDLAILDVRDNGHGIAEGEIPLIFDRFYRAGDEMTRTSQGTGLGLYLVQRIMRAHHGEVSVADTGPAGTTMRLSLIGVETGEDRE